MKHLSDRQLIEKYKEGDLNALNSLIKRYSGALFTYIYQMLGDKVLSEDVFGEVFLKMIKNIDRYRNEGKFKSWLYKITRHQVIDVLRKEKKMKVVSLDKEINPGSENPLTLEDKLSCRMPLPENILQNKNIQEDLEEAISSLSFEQREVFLLREYSNLSFKEIASMLKCPLNTVLGRMHYALRKLRAKLYVKYGGN
ncbi:sigma-70 family RNA polymerase sigma factor [bacterium]|nr:sigma-70 family RNA polymerase sigma factor [bacterium]